MVAVVVVGCESKEQRADREARAAADSFARLRRQGIHDVSNPEMGWKVLVRLFDDSMFLSHPHITSGQVTFAIENKSKKSRVADIWSEKNEWKTMPIKPNESVWLTTVLDAGWYTIFCQDTTAKGLKQRLGCKKSIVMEVKQAQIDSSGTTKKR